MNLAALLGLSQEEGRKAVPAALFQVLFVGTVALLKSVAAALVVGRASAAALPWLYIISAFTTAAAAGIVPQEARAPGREMFLWGGAILALAGASALGWVGAVLGLYLAGDAFATLNQVRFWARAGELFDLRASRRLFATFAAASMVGSVVGGGLVQLLAPVAGPVALAGLAGLFALGCAPLGERMDRSGPRRTRGARAKTVPWKVLGSDNLVRYVAIFVGVSSVLTVCVDFLFRARAGEVMNERQMAALFGAINVWMGIIAAAFQLVLARRLLDKLGLFYFLGLVPAACAGLAAASLFTHDLFPVMGLKVVEAAGSLSLTPLAVQLLYGPLPDDRRNSARAAIDGLMKKGGLGIGGLMLIAFGSRLGPYLSLLSGGVAVGLVLLLSRLQRVYVDQLGRRLSRNHWDSEITLDAQGRRVLRQGLKSDREGVVLRSLELLAEAPEELTAGTLFPLLRHKSERVQERVVELVGRLGHADLVPEIRALTMSERRRTRGAAVRALAQLAPSSLERDIAPLLEHPDSGTRGAAIAALWRHPPTHARAEAALLAMQRPDADVQMRRELAKLLGRLDPASSYAPLRALVDDSEPSVRALAYNSAAHLGLDEWTPLLIERLGSRADRKAARAALAAFGDRALPSLESALNDRNLPLAIRLELPRVLRDMGTSDAANALLHSNIRDTALLQHRIGVALASMRRANPSLALDVQWVKDAIGRRLDIYDLYSPVLADLRAGLPPTDLLVRAVTDRLDQSLAVAFQLVALLAPHDQVMDAHHRLRAGGASERAFAAELVENVLPDRSLRRRMAVIIDGYHRHATPGNVGNTAARVAELAFGDDRILRALARGVGRRLGLALIPPPLEIEDDGELTEELLPEQEDEMSELVVETMFLLEGVELFEGSGVDDIAALAAIAREVRVPAGRPVFRRGDPGERFYVIVKGDVRVERDGKVAFRLGARDSFGEVSLLDGAPRPADVIAETDLHLLAIDRQEFLDLVADRPELLQGVLQQLAHHLRLMLEGPGGTQVSLKRQTTAERQAVPPPNPPTPAKAS